MKLASHPAHQLTQPSLDGGVNVLIVRLNDEFSVSCWSFDERLKSLSPNERLTFRGLQTDIISALKEAA